MNNPNFEKLLDAFNEKTLRPALAAGKEKLDLALATLPTDDITRSLEDTYAQLANMDVFSNLGSLDTTKIADAVEHIKAQLEKPVVSQAVAKGVKEFLDRNPTETLEATVSKLTAKASPIQQLTIQMMLFQLAPKLDELRAASVDDVAAQIRTGAGNLSGNDIAVQISLALQTAPMLLAGKTDLTGKLPAPQDVIDVVQGVGKVASTALDNASKGATFAETLGALKQFSADANAVVARVLAQDNTPPAEKPVKKTPKRKGGKGFKF